MGGDKEVREWEGRIGGERREGDTCHAVLFDGVHARLRGGSSVRRIEGSSWCCCVVVAHDPVDYEWSKKEIQIL